MDNEIGAPDSPMTEEMDFVEDQYGDGLTDSYLTEVESVISVNENIQAPTNEAESIVEGIQRIEVGGVKPKGTADVRKNARQSKPLPKPNLWLN